MSKKVVISIPVHEAPEVVEDQLNNIKKFVNNSCVILHASAHKPEFYNQIKNLINKFADFAFLNSISYDTHAPGENANVTGLGTVHCSNFRYIENLIDFDYFALETSNDMFVRKGVEILWNNYDVGCATIKSNATSYRNDGEKYIIELASKYIKFETIEIHAPEGTFYPKNIFKEISHIVLDKINYFRCGEEIIIPSLAFNIDKTLYDKNCNSSYVFHNWKDGYVKKEDIISVKNGEKLNKYSVKRVPRNMNDDCRLFIREINKNE